MNSTIYILVEKGQIITAFHNLAILLNERPPSSNAEIYSCIVNIPVGQSLDNISFKVEKMWADNE